jgi:hypothetical protein
MRTTSSSLATALALVTSIVDASTLTPPVVPLIVRNPYLSTWLGNARDVPWQKWPMFYTGQEVIPKAPKAYSSCAQWLIAAPQIGFGVLASVPLSKTVYPLLGRPHDSLPEHGGRK